MKVQIKFFSCLVAVLFVVSCSSGILGRPSWDIEFIGDTASYSSGGSIDVALQITARDVFEGVTATVSLPYGWSVSSGPSKYELGEVTEKSVVGWTLYGGRKESLEQISVIVISTNPALTDTVKLSQADVLPRVDSANSAPSGADSIEQDGDTGSSENDVASSQKTSFFNLTGIKQSIRIFFSGDEECEQVTTYAKDGSTGECREFSTPCDVPEGWKTVESCPEEIIVDVSSGGGETPDILSRALRALYYIVIAVVVAVLVLVALSAYRLYRQKRTKPVDKRYSFE